MASSPPFEFKVVLLGEGSVGKTSIFLRYFERKFNDQHLSTEQAAFNTKKLTIANKRVHMHIWDTAGQEKFHAIAPLYYRESKGAILVYDITDQDSFSRVKTWVKELRKMCGSELVLSIVGNKNDLEKNRHVDESIAQAYATSVGASHSTASAKLNKGIEELFLDLTKRLLATHKEPTINNNVTLLSQPIGIVEDNPQKQLPSSGGCCG